MKQHLSKEEIEDYAGRKLRAERLLAADLHLSACPLCQNQVRSLSPAGKLSPAASVTHLSYEQMTDYLDAERSLDARSAVEQHLKSCLLCSDELGDLKAFDQVLASDPVLEETRTSFWESVAAFFRVPQRLVAAAAVVLFFALLQRVHVTSGQATKALNYGGGSAITGNPLLLLGLFLAAIGGGIYLLNKFSKK